jgi:hypothetical protein
MQSVDKKKIEYSVEFVPWSHFDDHVLNSNLQMYFQHIYMLLDKQ